MFNPASGAYLALACVALCGPQLSAQVAVEKHKVLELTFTADESGPNPFDVYRLRLEVTDPAGQVFAVEGFYDGNGHRGQEGRIWKARLCPYLQGEWSWRTIPGDAPDKSLAGLSGRFRCVESDDQGGILSHGRHFKFQDGGYFFPVGNFLDPVARLPMWSYLGEETTEAQRDAIIARHRDVYAANKYYFYVSNHSDVGSDLGGSSEFVTPWVGTRAASDKTKMDIERWTNYDAQLGRLKDNRMIAQAVIFEDGKRGNYGSLPEADKNRLFRYLMARTSAFSHMMYVICMEWPEAWKKDQVSAAGNFLQAHNPWRRPLSVHLLTSHPWVFSGENWPTFVASQSGNKAGPDTVNQYALSMRGEPIPNLADEFGILKTESDALLRGNMWAAFCGGAAGVGTGSDQKALQRFLVQSRIPFQRMSPVTAGLTAFLAGSMIFGASAPPPSQPGISSRRDLPAFWKSRLEDVENSVGHVKKGTMSVLARTPGGRNVYLVAYGERDSRRGTANYNSAAGGRVLLPMP